MKRFQHVRQWFNLVLRSEERSIRGVFYILLAVIMYASLFSNVAPDRIEVEVLGTAEQDIISPITVEDQAATEKKRIEAAAEVEDQYSYYPDYVTEQINLVSDFFAAIKKVKDEQAKEQADDGPADENPEAETLLEKVRGILPEEVNNGIDDTTLETFLSASENELSIAREMSVTTVHDIMSNKVTISDIQAEKRKAAGKFDYSSLNESMRKAAADLAGFAVIPNYVFDPEATIEKRNEAKDGVQPVMIRAGEVLAAKGDVITREDYRKLELTGITSGSVKPYPYMGLAVIVIMLTVMIAYYFKGFEPVSRDKNVYYIMYLLIFLLLFVSGKLTSLYQGLGEFEIGYLVPAAFSAMMIKMLMNERLAVMTSVIFAVAGSIMFNGGMPASINFPAGMYFLFSGVGAVLFLDKQNRRSKILTAGIVIAGINILSIAGLTLLKYNHYSGIEIGMFLGYGVLSGLLAAVLTLGMMPFFEAGFGVISEMKLIELSNPNHPLLRKILTETPGTYHHSVMVANISESACEAIGANGLLARVGAYYHDLGKTKQPHYFIENQMGRRNPHDDISPQRSRDIIIAHTSNGAEMLRKHKMPKEIVDIAEQHHGTTLLKFFYHKAAEHTDESVSENDYRYPGPKPQTKEAAIVGIADSVEAAVRSLRAPTSEKVESLVRSIISDRLQDGQFNECDITVKELETAAAAMCETVHGIFHSRIEYPELSAKKVIEA
ncbi:HD family phosphohydrolase [Bacillus marinisedimentorum]|uniref:HD family phosphohydrolase n=1 Tax=Bacillus marinisedimentorum TaxID=1821260 RepID=UPI0008723CB3|nr:HD family phosphohydrolase [Bacillus marinisedimentorum]